MKYIAEYLPQRKKYLQWLGDYLDKIDVVSNKEDTITIAS